MKYNLLPNTETKVSEICLGTMTFGEQNSEKEAHEQLDYSLANGVNFIDTAELYPIPRKEETCHTTEKYIGSWMAKNKDKRKDLVLSTKISGSDKVTKYIRNPMDFSPKSLRTALEGSLKRLQTDYIDLYQLHWPERHTNIFGMINFSINKNDMWEENFVEILETIKLFIQEGKIKHFGVSNETPWGLMKFIEASKSHNLPRIVTTQNPYSLLNRSYERNTSEVSYHENIGLLAYSPLAFGLLTGKYIDNTQKKSRLGLYPQMIRYNSENSRLATIEYNEIAKKHNIPLSKISLAYLMNRPFVSSVIIGATTMEQLKENIDSINTESTPEIENEINNVFLKYKTTDY